MREDRPDLARSFDEFYNSTRGELLGQLYLLCADRAEAEDCLQEAYMRAWGRWADISTYDRPAAWVRMVAWRLAIGRWRRHRVRSAVARTAAYETQEPDETIALVLALRQLPEPQRHALVLHDLWGLTVQEISDQTGAPTGTIKARLSRARTSLSHLLEDE